MAAETLTALFPWFAIAAVLLGALAGGLALAAGHRRYAATFVLTVSVLLGLFMLWISGAAGGGDGPGVLGLVVIVVLVATSGTFSLAFGLLWLLKHAPPATRRAAQAALFVTVLFIVTVLYANIVRL